MACCHRPIDSTRSASIRSGPAMSRLPNPGRAKHPMAMRKSPCCRSTSAICRRDCCERSEEHTSELQSLMRISYAVFCLKKKQIHQDTNMHEHYIVGLITHKH